MPIDYQTGEITGDDTEPRPFDQTLRELGEGSTNHELGDALHRLIDRVQDTGKGGSLTLTIAVASDGAGRIAVKDTVSLKLPEHNRPTTSFYVDKQGNPSRRDPNQPALPNLDDRRANREAN